MKWIFSLIMIATVSSSARPIKVLVIDTGVDASNFEIMNHIDKKDVDLHPNYYEDFHGHGTHIAGIVLKDTCSNVVVYSCKFMDSMLETDDERMTNEINCFKLALTNHMDVINFSGGGPSVDMKEHDVVRQVLNTGTYIITAVGNGGWNPDKRIIENGHSLKKEKYYPASYNYKYVYAVGALNEDGTIYKYSNYGFKGMYWERGVDIESTLPNNRRGMMSGSSQATAVYTNKYLKKICSEVH